MNIDKKIEEKLKLIKLSRIKFEKIINEIDYFCNESLFGECYTYTLDGYKINVFYGDKHVLTASLGVNFQIAIYSSLHGAPSTIMTAPDEAESVIEEHLVDHYCG